MKSTKFIVTAIIAVISGVFAMVNHTTIKNGINQNRTIKVAGACNMCKDRIEKAAKLQAWPSWVEQGNQNPYFDL